MASNIHFEATTIVCVRRNGKTAIAGDGQVTMGNTMIMKNGAKKVRRLYNGKVLAGFAGTVADAFTLFDKFEAKLNEFRGNLTRAAVEMVKEWRTDRVLQKLEALMIVADATEIKADQLFNEWLQKLASESDITIEPMPAGLPYNVSSTYLE